MNQRSFLALLDLPRCAFGNEADGGPGHCPACRAECARLMARFRADVKAGKCDSEGYTPSERRAMRRKEAA
jgi:hypothetical protein